jgi:hypothetical protein
MFLGRHLIGRDFLVDPLDERGRGDIGDRIGLADQPAGGFQRLFHPVQQLCGQLVAGRAALFLGVGPARHPQPGFLAFLARNVLELFGEFLVGPFRRGFLQMVTPVEDDEIADQPVDMADPVAHQRAFVRAVPPQSGVGKGFVEIFADGAALVQRPAVVDHGRDHAQRIDLQIFRRVMFHVGHVYDMALVAEALFLEAQPDPARGARTPAMVKHDHALLLGREGHRERDRKAVAIYGHVIDGYTCSPAADALGRLHGGLQH